MKPAASAKQSDRIYNASLSTREAALLAGWERERRQLVAIADLRDAVGVGAANDVAARLMKKKVLERVGRGRYLVRPLRTQGRPTAVSAPVVAAALLQGERFYLGGLWALSFHRLSEQQYTSALDAFATKRHLALVAGSARVTFHRVPRKALSYGTVEEKIEGLHVQVSTPERTLLDLLDLPALAGGSIEALRQVKNALARVSSVLLIEHAARGSRTSTCQRLGVLLERAGVSARKLAPLAKRVRGTKSLLSLQAGSSRTGSVNTRWSVVEND